MNDYQKYGEYSSKECSGAEIAKTAVTFLLIGAGVGALLSLLLTPRSGPEIREAFRGKFDNARRSLNQQTSRLRERTRKIAGDAGQKVTPFTLTGYQSN